MPPGYELLNQAESLQLIARLLWLSRKRHDGIGALTFGAHMPNNRVSPVPGI